VNWAEFSGSALVWRAQDGVVPISPFAWGRQPRARCSMATWSMLPRRLRAMSAPLTVRPPRAQVTHFPARSKGFPQVAILLNRSSVAAIHCPGTEI